MEFIKRHYEKLILAFLLLFFLLPMAYLLHIISDTAAITKAGLKLPEKEPDHQAVTETDARFDRLALLAIGSKWPASTPRSQRFVKFGPEYANLCSDLVDIYAVARCPHCLKLIPRKFFNDAACPLCNKELKKPTEEDDGNIQVASGDIPDSVKEKYGIDKNDPMAVLDDLDKDGFSNLYEYKNKTDLSNPRSRPPLWHRLVLTGMHKVVLPFSLMKVNTNESTDKDFWLVQINSEERNRTRTHFLKLGGRLKMDGEDYTVSEIKPSHTKTASAEGGENGILDKSIVIMQNNDKTKTIVMQVGERTFSPEPKIFLTDVGDGRKFEVDVGKNIITLGRPDLTGVESYQVVSIDQKKNTVMLSQVTVTRSGKVLERKEVPDPITKEGKIPPGERVRLRGGDAPGGF